MKINDPNWYPCYLNPSFNELMDLAKSGWDTCRILVNPDNKDLIIASGYGNTHNSIQGRYYIHLGAEQIEVNGRTRWRGKALPLTLDSYILYHNDGIAYFNLDDISGDERARYNDWSKYFEEYHVELLKDLIRESDLAL